jgi:hypothetical protein
MEISMKLKPVLINEELHKKTKDVSSKTGISIKSLVETALIYYLKKIEIFVNEEK